MCGIVALISLKQKVIEHLLGGLKQLQNRGYDSAGICTLNESLNILKFASTDSEDSMGTNGSLFCQNDQFFFGISWNLVSSSDAF